MNFLRIVPVLIIIVVHLLLLQWLLHGHRARPVAPEKVVAVHLFSQPVVSKFVAAPHQRIPTATRHRRAPEAITELAAPIPEVGPAMTAEPGLPPATEAIIDSLPTVLPTLAEPGNPPALALTTQAPPAADYLLDVVRTEPGVAHPYYGSGEIQWRQDGQSYTMRIEVGVDILFTRLRLYATESHGSLADTGIRPAMMTETRRGRSATATHFNYPTKTISFSASTAVMPMQDGAQDRATIVMQLASIGNGNPEQFQDGKEFTIQVAEDRDAAIDQFVVTGQETITTKLGQLATWHLVRPPRPGVYSSRLDIWLAPELHWLPVQIRNTEANGAVTTQTIRKIISGNPP